MKSRKLEHLRNPRHRFFGLALILFLSLNSLAQTKPNILFCIWDDAGLQQGAYGNSYVKTPVFDSLAKNGILFRNAYTPNAKCAPSRSSIVTGRNPWQLGAAGNHNPIFPPEYKTISEALAEKGYATGFTGKGCEPVAAGGRNLTGPSYQAKTIKPPTNQISGVDYAANFADFYNAKATNSPFCFWVGSREPHRGYEYGSGIKKGGKALSDIPEVPAFWPDNETVRNDILDYALEVEWFDTQVGKIIDFLKQKNQLDNTLVIFTSDNGMPFPRSKGNSYDFPTHLPLAAMWKNGIKNPGRSVTDFVSFIDFTPTFLEVAGVTPALSGMQTTEGKSLTDIFNGTGGGQINPQRNYVILGRERNDVGRPGDVGYPIRAIIKDDFLFIYNFKPERWPSGNPECGYPEVDGGPTKTVCIGARKATATHNYWQLSFGLRDSFELYQLSADRYCINNLANKTQYAAVQSALKSQLISELTRQKDPRILGTGDQFDNYPFDNANLNNWYARFLKKDPTIAMDWFDKTDFDTVSGSDTVRPSQIQFHSRDKSAAHPGPGMFSLVTVSGKLALRFHGHEPLKSITLLNPQGKVVKGLSGIMSQAFPIEIPSRSFNAFYLITAVREDGVKFSEKVFTPIY